MFYYITILNINANYVSCVKWRRVKKESNYSECLVLGVERLEKDDRV
jgi:hypothetical protein